MAYRMELVAANEFPVQIQAGPAVLAGDLTIPESAIGAVVFSHGSGSSRHSPRNRFVAQRLQDSGFATLLMDLLTAEEEVADMQKGILRFEIGLLAGRLLAATEWLEQDARTTGLRLGYFGASTGAAAALVAAAKRPDRIRAIVSRGGRPDLAGEALAGIRAPVLLIVGGADEVVLSLNRDALMEIGSPIKRLEIVRGASHLFEEPGKLEIVARLAVDWFTHYFSFSSQSRSSGTT